MRPTLDRREAERLVNTYADSILRLSYAYPTPTWATRRALRPSARLFCGRG